VADSSPYLSIADHRRDIVGMKYVYPVISRRAGGVSVGINLNPNNACNWQCIYCQVPNLVRGSAPTIDLALLAQELKTLFEAIIKGHFLEEHVADSAHRRLMDVAFSGNGEPTSAREFPSAVAIVRDAMQEWGLSGVKLRLITNGSLLDRAATREGVALIAAAGGEVWFKVDAATPAALALVNGTRTSPATVLKRLNICAALCPTWLQSCVFLRDGHPPPEEELEAYIALLPDLVGKIQGIHLYGLARPSLQPGADRLGRLPAEWLDAWAEKLRRLGLTVNVSP
jgi:wyosine [tRNA(Phe)-imidazoG37] synthetase (radical SAM superfamily)